MTPEFLKEVAEHFQTTSSKENKIKLLKNSIEHLDNNHLSDNHCDAMYYSSGRYDKYCQRRKELQKELNELTRLN